MHFAAFSCTVVTKQWGKQLLAWWRKRTVVLTQIKYERSPAGGGGATELWFGPDNRTKCESTLKKNLQFLLYCHIN